MRCTNLAGAWLGCLALVGLTDLARGQGTREFYLYDDLAALPWSGRFGSLNGRTIDLDLESQDNPASGVYHARMTFSDKESLAGIYIQSAPSNWLGPGIELCALRLTFRIRSNRTDQTIEVKAFNDQQFRFVPIHNANVWQTEEFDLNVQNCTDIHNVLAFVAHNPVQDLTVDVDDIALVYDAPAGSRHVRITGSTGPPWSYQLRIDDTPFFVQGVGYNNTVSADYAEDLALISQMNANTLRVWGQADAGFALLDEADRQGLMVIPAFWLLRGDEGAPVDYSDRTYQAAVSHSVLNWVACLKDHPAVLMWSLGNEVWTNLPSNDRSHFVTLIRSLAPEIHTADPQHPVTYASRNNDAFDALENTALDLFAANSYADLPELLERHESGSSSKPILFLEFGCDGWWERDWNDYKTSQRARDYALRALLLKSWSGVTLGGTAFAWIDKTEMNYTGWGIVNDDRSTRPQWSALRRVFGGKALLPRPR